MFVEPDRKTKELIEQIVKNIQKPQLIKSVDSGVIGVHRKKRFSLEVFVQSFPNPKCLSLKTPYYRLFFIL